MAGERTRDIWSNLTFPFVALWMLLKIFWFTTGVLGLRPRKPRLADVVFPAILRVVDGSESCTVLTADDLRRNPLGVSSAVKLVLIDSGAKLYTVSNMHQPYSDLRTLWRLVAPSPKPIAYRFNLRRRRSGLDAAKRALGGLIDDAALDAAESIDHLMSAVRQSAILHAR